MPDINQLILTPDNILVPELKGYSCEIDIESFNDCGLIEPNIFRGRFCNSYKFNRNSQCKCLRIWREPNKPKDYKLDDRLKFLSEFLIKHQNVRKYFVNFTYSADALKDGIGGTYPGLMMDWADGKHLGDFINTGHDNGNPPSQSDIELLAKKFMQMCIIFKEYNIAHGDLSNKNIIITTDNEIKLVDYDSLYLPKFEHLKDNRLKISFTGGAGGFQHPQRLDENRKLEVKATDDNFSQQIIYLSLIAIARSKDIYDGLKSEESNLLKIGDDLLFNNIDLQSAENLEKSNGYKAIKKYLNSDTEVMLRLEELVKAIRGPLEDVRSIVDFEMPIIKNNLVEYCIMCGLKFPNQTDAYCTRCGAQRYKYQS